MKNNLSALFLPVLVAACSNTPNTTVADWWNNGKVKTVENYQYVNPQNDNESYQIIEQDISYEVNRKQLPNRAQQYEEDAPAAEVYAIPAGRAVNKMLKDTLELYNAKKATLFLDKIDKLSSYLPDGVFNAEQTAKKIIENSRTFEIVENKDDADYVLSSTIENRGLTTNPILLYKLTLKDKNDKLINVWKETFSRVTNDDHSWW